ncbi:hypothetical protein OnM2_002037 [Erysiphe neolycopersici]|uniref:Uncharacterized protein n=1 Tax=Erysiphe neolycopersici TaxID=212602 RepID=A0A420I7Y5_9PEZI|nr:hypothetical protein OnM2_002037 [Erysiphe neolycopersici]
MPPPKALPSEPSPSSSKGSLDLSNSTSAPARALPSDLAPSRLPAPALAPGPVPAAPPVKSSMPIPMPPVASSLQPPIISSSSPISPEPPVLPEPPALPDVGASNADKLDFKLPKSILLNDDKIVTLSQLMNAPTPVPTASSPLVPTVDSVLDTIPDCQKGPGIFAFPSPGNDSPTILLSKESTPTGAPRKEINPTNSSISSTSQTAGLQQPTGLTTSSQLTQALSPHESHQVGILSPLAEHILVALGAIGAFIIIVSLLFLITGMKGKNPFYPRRKNSFSRHGERGFVEFDRGRNSKFAEEPPQYSYSRGSLNFENYDKKQEILVQSSPERYKRYEVLESTPRLQRSSTGRSEINPNNSIYDLPRSTEPYIGQKESYMNPQIYSNSSKPVPYEMSETINSFSSNYNNPGTLEMYGSPNAYGAGQNQRISFVSSISSGFGDGLILPAPTVVTTDEIKHSQQILSRPPPVSKTRLSFFNGKRRDSLLSTFSNDTVPRFRTIASWVKHQSDRLEQNTSGDHEASLPSVSAKNNRS